MFPLRSVRDRLDWCKTSFSGKAFFAGGGETMTEEGKRLVKMAVKNEGECDRVEMEEGELAADG